MQLTSPPLVHTIEADDVSFLRQAYQGEQHVELVPPKRYVGAVSRGDKRHDARLRLGTKTSIGKQLGNTAGRGATGATILADNGIKRLDIAVGNIRSGQQVPYQLGAALLLPRRRHVPRRGVLLASIAIIE